MELVMWHEPFILIDVITLIKKNHITCITIESNYNFSKKEWSRAVEILESCFGVRFNLVPQSPDDKKYLAPINELDAELAKDLIGLLKIIQHRMMETFPETEVNVTITLEHFLKERDILCMETRLLARNFLPILLGQDSFQELDYHNLESSLNVRKSDPLDSREAITNSHSEIHSEWLVTRMMDFTDNPIACKKK